MIQAILDRCDNFTGAFVRGTIKFVCGGRVVGYVTPEVVNELQRFQDFHLQWTLRPDESISLNAATFEERSAVLAQILECWRSNNTFGVRDAWRNELYGVYGASGKPLLAVERGGYWLFGFVSYGVHCTMWRRSRRSRLKHDGYGSEGKGRENDQQCDVSSCTRAAAPSRISALDSTEGDDLDTVTVDSIQESALGPIHSTIRLGGEAVGIEDILVLVPRRSPKKQTWPNMLDNSVAGGIAYGDDPVSSMVRECEEEACLRVQPEMLQAAGTVSYIYLHQHQWYQPEVQYVFDLELPDNWDAQPNDGEVETFHLWPIPQVLEEMAKGHFKPNCALVLLDFFVRHGVIGAEHPDYLSLLQRIHRTIPHPLGVTLSSRSAGDNESSNGAEVNSTTETAVDTHTAVIHTQSSSILTPTCAWKGTAPPYALIILNQPIDMAHNLFIELWNNASLHICADGGTNQLYDYDRSLQPDIIAGDLDSLRPEVRSYFADRGAEVLHFTDQDTTDFMKSTTIAVERGMHLIYAVCGMGGRVDHALGNLNHLFWAYSRYRGCETFLISNNNLTCLLRPGETIVDCTDNVGAHCGLLPLGEPSQILRTDGLRWNMEHRTSQFGGLVSTCNVIDAPKVTVSVDHAMLWTMEIGVQSPPASAPTVDEKHGAV